MSISKTRATARSTPAISIQLNGNNLVDTTQPIQQGDFLFDDFDWGVVDPGDIAKGMDELGQLLQGTGTMLDFSWWVMGAIAVACVCMVVLGNTCQQMNPNPDAAEPEPGVNSGCGDIIFFPGPGL